MKNKIVRTLAFIGFTAGLSLALPLLAADTAGDEQAKAAELAKKIQNPVASLISVPIQNNWDFGYGTAGHAPPARPPRAAAPR